MPPSRDAIATALTAPRVRGFWVAGYTALLLSVLSFVNPGIVRRLNAELFHASGLFEPAGWWLYLALRLPIAAFLVWTIVRLPSHGGTPDEGSASIKQAKVFDPLMGLRAFACVVVILGHYFRVVFPFSTDGMSFWIPTLLSSFPWAGVWLFFALSGYLMGKGFAKGRYSLDGTGAKLFFRNRMLRIVPIYFSGLFLVGLYRYAGAFSPKYWWVLIEASIFDYRADLPINPLGALWSVSTEVQFYLLVPLLMVVLVRCHRRLGGWMVLAPPLLLAAGTCFRIYLQRQYPTETYRYVYSPLIPNLDIFVAGMSINLVPTVREIPAWLRRWLVPLLAVSVLTFYVFICCVGHYERGLHLTHPGDIWVYCPAPTALFAACFIYLAEARGKIAIRPGWLGRFLLAVQGIGTLTYCLYVFHSDVLLSVRETLPASLLTLRASLAHFPLVMLEVFAVAAFFYFAVEKPFDAKKKVSGTALLDAP